VDEMNTGQWNSLRRDYRWSMWPSARYQRRQEWTERRWKRGSDCERQGSAEISGMNVGLAVGWKVYSWHMESWRTKIWTHRP